MLCRILDSARYTVGIALPATALASGAGTCSACWLPLGGLLDAALSRSFDALISMPQHHVRPCRRRGVRLLGPRADPDARHIYTPGCFRIVALDRGQHQRAGFRARSRGRAARALSTSCCEEILPNMVGPVLTDFGLRFVFVVLLLSEP